MSRHPLGDRFEECCQQFGIVDDDAREMLRQFYLSGAQSYRWNMIQDKNSIFAMQRELEEFRDQQRKEIAQREAAAATKQ